MKKGTGVTAVVRELARPLADEFGYTLWDVEYVKEGADMYLRITIDRPEGITLDDCEKMHRAIDPLLDEADPIEGSYHLEISSPGIIRELKTEEHVRACIGWDVEVRLYAPVDGKKTFLGTLMEPGENGEIRITDETDGKEKSFLKSAVSHLRTRFDFDDEN